MSVEMTFELDQASVDAYLMRVHNFEIESLRTAGVWIVKLAQRIVEEIKTNYVPVFTGQEGRNSQGFSPKMIHVLVLKSEEGGTLRDSVDCDKIARFTVDTVEVSIWAGGPGSGAEEYAAIQHENLMYHHYVGQAKYIEIPVVMIAPTEFAPALTMSMQEAIKSAWA